MKYVKIVAVFDDVKYAFYVNNENMRLLSDNAVIGYMAYLRIADFVINLDKNEMVKCRLTVSEVVDRYLNL